MNVKTFARVAMVSAIYTVVSLTLAPFTFGPIQVRIAEALTLLPLLDGSMIYGVTLGCFLTNLLGALWGLNPLGFLDAAIGTPATFLAALLTFYLKDKKVKGLPIYSMMMPVLFNFVFIGAELAYVFYPNMLVQGFLLCGSQVAIGEAIAIILGWFFLKPLEKTKIFS